MRTITIDRCAWHYRLLKAYGFSRPKDFCAYTRSVMGALLLTLVLASLITVLTICVAHLFAWVAAMLFSWTGIEPEPYAIFAALISVVLATMGACFAAVHMWIGATAATRHAFAALPEEQQLKLADWWGAIRDRVCFRVDFL